MNNDLPPTTQFGALSFADNYTVNGNAISLSGGISTLSGNPRVLVPLTLTASQSWDSGSQSHLQISSADINGMTLTINSNAAPDLSLSTSNVFATITGTGSVVVNGGNTSIRGGSTSVAVTNNGVLIADLFGSDQPLVNHGSLFLRNTFALSGGLINYGVLHSQASNTSLLDLKPGSTLDASIAQNQPDTHIQADSIVIEDATLEVHCGFFLGPGDVRIIIDNRGQNPIQGTFASLPEGSIITASGTPQRFRLSYAGLNGRSVTLTSVGERSTVSFRQASTFQAGRPMIFNVKVSGTHGTPTGEIITSVNGEILPAQTLDATGAASIILPALQASTGNIFTAFYAGDPVYTGVSGNTIFIVFAPTPIPALNTLMLIALLFCLAALALAQSR